MPYVEVDQMQMYVEEHGQGEPLLFIHGLGSSSRDWFAQVDAFKDDFRVLTCDLRGHGRSDVPPGPYSVPQFARDVAVMLRKQDAAPAHVVGVSMGGMVALQLAADAPALVRRLAVINSMDDLRLHTWREVWTYASRRGAVQALGMRTVGEILAQRLFIKPDQERLRQQFVERWAQNDRDAYLASIDAIKGWHLSDRLGDIHVPTLVIASDEDYTPVAAKNRTVARMPNARLAVIEDARHAVPVERPDEVNALLHEFLTEET